MTSISVIIPLFNKEKDIVRFPACFKNNDFEIIIVDDGSTDLNLKKLRL